MWDQKELDAPESPYGHLNAAVRARAAPLQAAWPVVPSLVAQVFPAAHWSLLERRERTESQGLLQSQDTHPPP